jgi:carbamoyltransferase
MGVCYAYASQNGINSKPLANAYLGPEYIVSEKLLHRAQNDGYRILDANNSLVANLLNQGHVIGRCCERMEFGARSLGNRSIIANPKEISTIDKINQKIKNRDFWMPFAPSIIEEDFNKYALNKNDIRSPFMTIGFESTDLARREIPAALHPSDKTLRPHVVSSKSNPNYHSLLDEFKSVSGISGVLNTSFNLHGEPIVCTPEDAYRVFQLSDIDALLFDEKIILKKMN